MSVILIKCIIIYHADNEWYLFGVIFYVQINRKSKRICVQKLVEIMSKGVSPCLFSFAFVRVGKLSNYGAHRSVSY